MQNIIYNDMYAVSQLTYLVYFGVMDVHSIQQKKKNISEHPFKGCLGGVA